MPEWSVGAEEIKAWAAKWPGTLASACRRLADSQLGPNPEKELDEQDRAALAFMMKATLVGYF
jgi:hypothetical protein